jgi:hypothetical protein
MTTVDARWTHFQNPYRLEDALGVIHAIPSEISYEELENMITGKFRQGAGSEDVGAGNYELFRTKNRSQLITADTYSNLRPGTEITMAIVLSTIIPGSDICPIWHCQSSRIAKDPRGGFVW